MPNESMTGVITSNNVLYGTIGAYRTINDVTVDGVSVVSGHIANIDLSGKVDKESGKGLSTEDYTSSDKSKLQDIAPGAEVNVQSDWNEDDETSDAYILNKPDITILENVQSDWNEADNTSDAYILNKPDVVTLSGVNGVEVGAESTYNSHYINWEESNGDRLNLSISEDKDSISINIYDAVEDSWATAGLVSLEDKSATVNVSFAGASQTSITARKCGKIVSFPINFSNSSKFTTATGSDVIGTLPENFRPRHEEIIPLNIRSSGTWSSATYYSCVLDIATNGSMTLRGKATEIQACQHLRGSVIFLSV